MPVPIPFGTRHTAVVEGSIDRLVVCEQCGIEYVFMVEGTAEATSTALLFSDESAGASGGMPERRAEHLWFNCEMPWSRFHALPVAIIKPRWLRG